MRSDQVVSSNPFRRDISRTVRRILTKSSRQNIIVNAHCVTIRMQEIKKVKLTILELEAWRRRHY